MGKLEEALGCLFGIAFLAFGVVQIYAAFLGIEDWLGTGWAIAAIVITFILRTSLPILVGAFLGALNVWEWHWIFAALFAAPMLIFILPAMAMELLGSLRDRAR